MLSSAYVGGDDPALLWGTRLTIPDLDFGVRKEPGSSKSQCYADVVPSPWERYADVVPNPWTAELAGVQAPVPEMGRCNSRRSVGHTTDTTCYTRLKVSVSGTVIPINQAAGLGLGLSSA